MIFRDCGTYAAYQRHIRKQQIPCDPCRQASADYHREWRNRPRPATDRRRDADDMRAAKARAAWRLARRHPEEFQQLVSDELARGLDRTTSA